MSDRLDDYQSDYNDAKTQQDFNAFPDGTWTVKIVSAEGTDGGTNGAITYLPSISIFFEVQGQPDDTEESPFYGSMGCLKLTFKEGKNAQISASMLKTLLKELGVEITLAQFKDPRFTAMLRGFIINLTKVTTVSGEKSYANFRHFKLVSAPEKQSSDGSKYDDTDKDGEMFNNPPPATGAAVDEKIDLDEDPPFPGD